MDIRPNGRCIVIKYLSGFTYHDHMSIVQWWGRNLPLICSNFRNGCCKKPVSRWSACTAKLMNMPQKPRPFEDSDFVNKLGHIIHSVRDRFTIENLDQRRKITEPHRPTRSAKNRTVFKLVFKARFLGAKTSENP